MMEKNNPSRLSTKPLIVGTVHSTESLAAALRVRPGAIDLLERLGGLGHAGATIIKWQASSHEENGRDAVAVGVVWTWTNSPKSISVSFAGLAAKD